MTVQHKSLQRLEQNWRKSSRSSGNGGNCVEAAIFKADFLELAKQGRLPWHPNDQVSGLDVWHQYETPLSGTFVMGDATILFTLVLENESDVSIWAYAELPPCIAESLADLCFESVEKLNAWVDDQFSEREAVLAFAKDGKLAR